VAVICKHGACAPTQPRKLQSSGNHMRQVTTAIKAALACAAPLLACSTYYTVERLGEASPIVLYAALAALPILTISLAAGVVALASGRRGCPLLWGSSIGIALPGLLLAVVWLR